MDDQLVQRLIEIKGDLGSIKENLGRQDERLITIETAVMGNGQPGLAQKVEALQSAKNWTWGFGAAITFLLGSIESWLHLGRHR